MDWFNGSVMTMMFAAPDGGDADPAVIYKYRYFLNPGNDILGVVLSYTVKSHHVRV